MLLQKRTKCLFLAPVILVLWTSSAECGRSGGGGRSRGGSSWSRPSRPSPSHPAPATRPSSIHGTPSSPSGNSGPIGFEHFKPVSSSSSGSHSAVGPPIHNIPNYGFNTGGSYSSAPGIGFKQPSAPPNEHATNSKPLGNANPMGGSSFGNPPPYGFKPMGGYGSSSSTGDSNPHPIGFKPSAPVGPPTDVKPVGNISPNAPYPVHPPSYTPHNPGVPPPAYNPAHNPAGYGPPPAFNPPAYNYNPASSHGTYPGGYGNQHYSGAPGGVTNININNINTNTHHYNNHQSYGSSFGYGGGYGGFGYHHPTYSYSSSDTGSGTLGFFLGYSLAKLTTPTYHHYNSYSELSNTPRYDHYEIHHYYHNRNSIPAQSTIEPNTIVGCVGDSGTICPAGTISLCTNNGAILCVASATSTVPCTDGKQGNCVKTTIPCVNGTNCDNNQNQTLTIPCISKAQVSGNITYINNTIIVNNTSIINNFIGNSSNGNGTIANTTSSTVSSTSTSVENATVPLVNSTLDALANVTITEVPSTVLPINVTSDTLSNITTTDVPSTVLPINVTSDGIRNKRDTPAVTVNDFCVTILAIPAKRKPLEQEILVEKAKDIFAAFLVRAYGINNN